MSNNRIGEQRVVSNNRIGEQCWYRSFDYQQRKLNEPRLGILRAWGTDYEELNQGVGLYPCAVIEDVETLQCVSVRVDNVTFT